MSNEITSEGTDQNNIFQIQRIYTKDISFESPKAPAIFQKEWEPTLDLNLNSVSSGMGDNLYEVVLRMTITAKIKEEIAFLCELQQAGLFEITNLEGDALANCLGAFCPTILFPYARECAANLISRGTFPQLNLGPINFDALFAEHQKQQNKQPPEAQKNHAY